MVIYYFIRLGYIGQEFVSSSVGHLWLRVFHLSSEDVTGTEGPTPKGTPSHGSPARADKADPLYVGISMGLFEQPYHTVSGFAFSK